MKAIIAALLMNMSISAAAIEPFSLPWVNHSERGTVYSSSDKPDAVFVLEFQANFCPACNENAANVDALAEEFKSEPRVQVLDISLDQNDREIAAWIRKHQPNHPVLKDVGKTVWSQVNAQYIPTVVVTNCRGEIKYSYTEVWGDEAKAELRKVIGELLAEPCQR